MVGRDTLDVQTKVRVLVPEPKLSGYSDGHRSGRVAQLTEQQAFSPRDRTRFLVLRQYTI